MTVYADVLIIINLFVNYVLLFCTARILKERTSRLRIFFGAAIGSIYGLIIFLPELPVPAELPIRIAVTLIIVLAVFGYSGKAKFLRSFFTFFAVSIGFGGVMLLLWLFVAPRGMVYRDGAVYFDINIVTLAVMTVCCFAVISAVSFFIERKAPRESVALVKISSGGKTAELKAIIDTGNSLREGFSGYPAAVAERSALSQILPQAVSDYFDGKSREESAGIRLIAHKTVSGTGVMPAFRPDSAEIKTIKGGLVTDKLFIAVTENNLAGGEYSMLLNPDILTADNYFERREKYAETAE